MEDPSLRSLSLVALTISLHSVLPSLNTLGTSLLIGVNRRMLTISQVAAVFERVAAGEAAVHRLPIVELLDRQLPSL